MAGAVSRAPLLASRAVGGGPDFAAARKLYVCETPCFIRVDLRRAPKNTGRPLQKRPTAMMAAPRTPQVILGRFWRGRWIKKNSQKNSTANANTAHGRAKNSTARPLSFSGIRFNSTPAPKAPQRSGGSLTRLLGRQILPVGRFCRGHLADCGGRGDAWG